MVRYGGSSAGSSLADPTSPIISHCASVVTTSTLRVNFRDLYEYELESVRGLRIVNCHIVQRISSLKLNLQQRSRVILVLHLFLATSMALRCYIVAIR